MTLSDTIQIESFQVQSSSVPRGSPALTYLFRILPNVSRTEPGAPSAKIAVFKNLHRMEVFCI